VCARTGVLTHHPCGTSIVLELVVDTRRLSHQGRVCVKDALDEAIDAVRTSLTSAALVAFVPRITGELHSSHVTGQKCSHGVRMRLKAEPFPCAALRAGVIIS
jgi:hypothetical protein